MHKTIAKTPEITPIEIAAEDDKSFPLDALAVAIALKLGIEVGSIEVGSSVGSREGDIVGK